MRFSGKTVVVTGASMGIGEAIATAFAQEGANVVLAARQSDMLHQLAARLREQGGRAVPVVTDVTVQEEVDRLVAEALKLTGRVDVLVNNAGVGMNGAVETLDLDAWRRSLEVNLLGPVRVAQAFLPHMKQAKSGTIVQVSSVLGKVSVPFTAGYNATKYALNAVSDALRLEVAPYGIRVVSVYPGSTESNFRSNSLGETNIPKVRPKKVPAMAVARRVVKAVLRGERDVYITWRDAALCWFGTRVPKLSDWVLRLAYRRRSAT